MAEHANSLKAFAARMLGDEATAEDIAQDAFLAYFRHIHSVPENAVRPWLFRVTRNLCLDQLRRRKFKLRLFRDVQKHDDLEMIPADNKGDRPDEEAHSAEARRAGASRRTTFSSSASAPTPSRPGLAPRAICTRRPGTGFSRLSWPKA